MMKTIMTISVLLLVLLGGCAKRSDSAAETGNGSVTGRKILYLDSYHESYEPNIKTRNGFESVLAGKGVIVRYCFLDEKNTPDSQRLAANAAAIHEEIIQFKPDLIVLADDPIMTWVAKRYLRESKIPQIFIGVNWQYDSITPMMTGQLEVELLKELIADLKSVSSGSRIGLITAETATDRKSVESYRSVLGVTFDSVAFVTTFDQWKAAFTAMQGRVDILILRQNAGISGWNDIDAAAWCREKSTIPTGSPNYHMNEYVLLCYPKLNEEYGEFAGKAALKVFAGTPVSQIPVEKNRRTNRTVNTLIAQKLNVTFPAEFLETAHLVPEKRGKIGFINSYHRGYEWSDGIESAFLKAVGISDSAGRDHYREGDLEVRFFYLDGKRKPLQSQLVQQANSVYHSLEKWQPDLIVAADDDAAKWVVVPHYKESKTPVLFCGLNWDASAYGFPTSSVTGMVEVSPVRELIRFLQPFARGTRIGYLGADVLSEQREFAYYQSVLGITFTDGALVKHADEWRSVYRRLQESCDLIVLLTSVGIEDWNDSAMSRFVLEESRIPTGTTARVMRHWAAVSFSRVSEEQGWWVGEQARKVLAGTAISSVPVAYNKRSVKHVHTGLLKKIGMKIPSSLMDSVFFAEEDEHR